MISDDFGSLVYFFAADLDARYGAGSAFSRFLIVQYFLLGPNHGP